MTQNLIYLKVINIYKLYILYIIIYITVYKFYNKYSDAEMLSVACALLLLYIVIN